MASLVGCNFEGDIAIVTIDAPPPVNALEQGVRAELLQRIKELNDRIDDRRILFRRPNHETDPWSHAEGRLGFAF